MRSRGRVHFLAMEAQSMTTRQRYIVLNDESKELEEEVELLKKFKVLRRTKRA